MKTQAVSKGLLAFLILAYSTTASATSLIDLFDLAVENDPHLKIAQANKSAQIEAKPHALSKLLPNIAISASAGKASHDIRDANPEIEREKQISNELNVSLVLTQPIFDLAAFREQKRADIEQTQAELHYRIAQQNLLFHVANVYFTTLSYKDNLNFARSERVSIANLLKVSEKKFEQGRAEAFDVLQTQAKHDMALAREIKLEKALVSQHDELMRVSGRSVGNLMSVTTSVPLIPPSPSNMEDWTNAATTQNLQIAAKKLESELIMQELKITRAERFPTLDFNASYGANDHGGAYPERSLDAIVSLDFNMALFDGNRISIQLRKKQHELERITHELEAKKREVLQKTRSAYLGILAGISYVKALNQAINSSEQALRSIKSGFEKGEKSAVDVLSVQQELFENRQAFATSRYEYILSILRLKHSAGTLSIDDLEQINTWLN